MRVVARMWRQGNGSRQVVAAFLVFLCASVALAVALVLESVDPEPWAPLGPYPTQQIVSASPVDLTDGSVDVIGTKCAEDDTPVRGVVRWQSVTPGGATVDAAEGSTVAAPTDAAFIERFAELGGTITTDPITGRRCLTRLFSNEIPAEVVKLSREWLAEGRRVAWVITGTESPADGAREGVPVVWATEPFEVIA